MSKYKRVAIIGAPGSGKTTLAIELKDVYNLPVVFLDSFYLLPNWVMRNQEEWIIDGTFIDTLEERVKVADLVIFLDFSTMVQLKGIFKRFFSNLGKDKIDMPGCRERLNPSFISYVATYNKKRRKYLVDILEKYDQNKILQFKTRQELLKWLENEK